LRFKAAVVAKLEDLGAAQHHHISNDIGTPKFTAATDVLIM
jgi:hypothetical protein